MISSKFSKQSVSILLSPCKKVFPKFSEIILKDFRKVKICLEFSLDVLLAKMSHIG